MRWYDTYILPPLLNCVCGLKPMRLQRKKVVPLAKGDVLEIGIGSGWNLPLYNTAHVSSLFAVDPYYKLNAQAQKLVENPPFPIALTKDSAAHLPLPENSIDTVLCTYTLCSISNPHDALQEIRRVLKPKGQFLFLEHGLAPDKHIAQWQNRLNPLWKPLAGGCNLNIDISQLLPKNKWSSDIEGMYLPKTPRLVGFNYWGTATPNHTTQSNL